MYTTYCRFYTAACEQAHNSCSGSFPKRLDSPVLDTDSVTKGQELVSMR
jgi:hypothetical protein